MGNFNLYMLMLLLIVAGIVIYFDYRRRNTFKLPVRTPAETPTIVKNNVIIGSHNYSLIGYPEELVSVIDVHDDAVIYMNSEYTLKTLQVNDFVLLYEEREHESISKQ